MDTVHQNSPWIGRLLIISVALCSITLPGRETISSEELLTQLAAKANLTGNAQESWSVSFRVTEEYSISNSLVAQVQSTDDQELRKKLQGVLDKIKIGQLPSQRSAEREGLIVASPTIVSVQSRLIAHSPESQEMLVSNNLDFITRTHHARIYSFIGGPTNKAFPGEAEIRPGEPNPLALSPGVIKIFIPRLIKSLTNITAEIEAHSVSSNLIVRGQMVQGCPSTIRMEFDLSRDWMPRLISVPECDGGLTDITIESSKESIGWVPVHAQLSNKLASGLVVYTEDWYFMNYQLHPTSRDQSDEPTIPVDYLVSEFRFNRPFTYVMGYRPPTFEELELMSKDTNAIIKYQRESRGPIPKAPKFRPLLLALIVSLFLLPLILFAKNRFFKETTISQLNNQ